MLAHKIQNEESSKLEFIPKDAVLLMIFHINTTDLKSIFYTNNITDIVLTDDAVKYLERIIANIVRDKKLILKMMLDDWFIIRLNNILYILLMSKNDFSNLNQLIDICTDNNIFSKITNDNINILFRLLGKANATETQTNCLFDLYMARQILLDKVLNYDNNMPLLVEYMAYSKHKLANPPILSEIVKIEDVEKQLSALSVLYPIVPGILKEEIHEIVCRFDSSKFDKKCWQHLMNMCIFNFDIATELLDAYIKADNGDCIQKNFILAGIYLKTLNAEIKELINQYSAQNHTLAFFINPQKFNLKDFDVKWLSYINIEQLKLFLLKEESLELAKKYLEQVDASQSKIFKDKLLACFS